MILQRGVDVGVDGETPPQDMFWATAMAWLKKHSEYNGPLWGLKKADIMLA